MSIQLISKTEKLVVEIGGGKFFYRRIPNVAWESYTTKHTERGKVNINAALDEVIGDHIYSWDHVVDENIKPIEFSKEMAAFLPDDVKADLIAAIRGSSRIDVVNADIKKK